MDLRRARALTSGLALLNVRTPIASYVWGISILNIYIYIYMYLYMYIYIYICIASWKKGRRRTTLYFYTYICIHKYIMYTFHAFEHVSTETTATTHRIRHV